MSRIERGIRIGDPGHFAVAGTGIGSRNVEAGTNQVLFRKFVGVAPGDALEDLDRGAVWIDLDGAFGPAERHVDDGALVGHERRERSHLGFVGRSAEPDAALRWQPVMAMLGPPRADDLDAAVAVTNGELKGVNTVARTNLIEETFRMVGECRRSIKVLVHVVFEAERRRRSTHRPRLHRLLPHVTLPLSRGRDLRRMPHAKVQTLSIALG